MSDKDRGDALEAVVRAAVEWAQVAHLGQLASAEWGALDEACYGMAEVVAADRIAALEAECARLRQERDALADLLRAAREMQAAGFSRRATTDGVRATVADGPEAGLQRAMLCAMAEYQRALDLAAERGGA